ncbi:universal stress protein [Noviherbaspirillum galbum]|uniref:Universal stress protein n=1 Tax=Noviherbaspirillum galbum TaxID=2709383 RepID=A0A6B3SHZ4_9BURK|nr:universal stress protein [Noviherbaspirillum galbum]NEX60474.1 universal stress protein [Noviherbaspirillum galbum]
MSYKTVLVHVDESEHAVARIRLAASIAMTQSAHLIGTAMTGASRYLVQTRMLAEMDPHLKTHLDFLKERARRGLDIFDKTAQQVGIASHEKRLVDDEAGGGICLQARYADLVVIGQNDPDERSPVVMPDFPQYVVLNSGRPVLLVPYSGQCEHIGKQVLIAWDGSMSATRTVTNAIPLLRRAQIVEVAVINAGAWTQTYGGLPGADIATYLGRHGITAEVVQHQADEAIGPALLGLAEKQQADLLVMGGYGHTRFREIVLGEVTRVVLERMAMPVLMSY